jgi:hypothetical protein
MGLFSEEHHDGCCAACSTAAEVCMIWRPNQTIAFAIFFAVEQKRKRPYSISELTKSSSSQVLELVKLGSDDRIF